MNIIQTFERNYKLLYFLSFVFLVIVLLPRFNQNNFWLVKNFVGNQGHLGEYSIDTQNYINIIDYYKGDKSKIDSISVPYTYRVLPTFAASLLPFNSLTNLNLLNLLSLLIALWVQILILERLKVQKGIIIIANLLFIFNFSTFYFGTSGVVDPFLIMLLYLNIYLILKNNLYGFFVFMFITAFSKETAIILIPFYIIYNGIKKDILLNGLIAYILFQIGTFLSRNIIHLDSHFIWEMEIENFLYNLQRPRSYFSYIISYSYFLPLIFYFLKHKYVKTKMEKSLVLGIILGNLIFIYSFWAAYPDARLIWAAYPFTLIYIAISLNKHLINKVYNIE